MRLHFPRRHCGTALLALAFLAIPPAAWGVEVVIHLPVDRSYTTERTIVVMGSFTGLEDKELEAVVNGKDRYRLKTKDDYYFIGEVDLEDGPNVIQVEKEKVSVLAGDQKKPPAGYFIPSGHVSPDDTCDQCHKAEFDDQGNFAKLQLLEPTEALCTWCHFKVVKPPKGVAGSSLHDPIREGKCPDCHQAHWSAKPALLKTDRKDLCQPCHQKLYEDIKGKAHIHGPLNVGGCELCHREHWSAHPFLLNAPGKELCDRCHGDVAKESQSKGILVHPGVDSGTCHNCHTSHASAYPKMMKRNVNTLCMECHPEKAHNFHEEKGFSIYICGRCHDIHKPDADHLLLNSSRDLCIQCHQKAVEGGTVHVPVAKESCFACHNFHERSFAREQSTVCFRCHDRDQRFESIHPVTLEPSTRCTICHAPHRSSDPHLTYPIRHKPFAEGKCPDCHGDLVAAGAGWKSDTAVQQELCFKCHPGKRIPQGKVEGLIVHKPFARETCLSCHLVHNSEHPSLLTTETLELCGQCHSFVKRIKSLIPTSAHKSFQEGRCGECHDTHLGTAAKLLKKPPRVLCAGCHAKLLQDGRGEPLPVVHKPMEEADCLACHQGHSSRFPSLLKDAQKEVCKGCHPEVVKGINLAENKFVHDPVAKGKCAACHQGHAGAYPGLLKAEGNLLCRKCHQNLAKGLHHNYQDDFTTYAADQLQGQKLACGGCHAGHYSPNRYLIRNQKAPICQQCHRF
jgi:predicted CXXCH cytochrome family protein